MVEGPVRKVALAVAGSRRASSMPLVRIASAFQVGRRAGHVAEAGVALPDVREGLRELEATADGEVDLDRLEEIHLSFRKTKGLSMGVGAPPI